MNDDSKEFLIAEILKYGNITKAASELGMSQPALSMSINQLERKLGFNIFNKKTSPISLTDEGNAYLEFLNKQKINKLELGQKIADIQDRSERNVAVGAPNVYILSVVAPKIQKIIDLIPNLHLRIESSSIPELIEMSISGDIDVFISTSEIADEAFECIPIKEETSCICIPRCLAENMPISDSDPLSTKLPSIHMLDNMPFIFLHDNQPLQVAFSDVINANNLVIPARITVDQVTSALYLSSVGIGCCIATSESLKAINDMADIDNLLILDFSDYIPQRTIYAVYPSSRYVSSACMSFIDILKEETV